MKKIFSLMMALCLCIGLASCGHQTLESYVEKNADISKVFESMNTEDEDGSVEVTVEDNTIIIVSQYNERMSKQAIKNVRKEKKKDEPRAEKTFGNLITSLEESTQIEGIEVQVIYQDKKGEEIYTNTYKIDHPEEE
ncbi:MAG: DUF4854 domain-containing protein [Clostridia bacterium]|nr:DUF4854 domain-containing protein [Clostridia bacterium]